MLAYFEGSLRPLHEARISVTSFGVNYGLGAFTGVRGYRDRTSEQVWLFRPADHFRRLLGAARILMCDAMPSSDDMVETLAMLLRANAIDADCYVRVLLYKQSGGLGARAHAVPHDICMYLEDAPLPPNDVSGVNLGTSSWRRVSDAAIPARGKICGTYVNSALARSDAFHTGFDEPLMLDESGHVAEGAGCNVFIVRDGTLITPPVSGEILEGITRASIIDLARDVLEVPVVERAVDRSELYISDEAFLCGTARGVVPVARLDSRIIGEGGLGDMTAELMRLYAAVTRAGLDEYRDSWSIPVYPTTGSLLEAQGR